jgi:hypothetical protein
MPRLNIAKLLLALNPETRVLAQAIPDTSTLQAQIRDAEERGDLDEVVRLQAKLDELRGQ